MKSVITLGDIHGRTCWNNTISHEDYDLIVFLGDYCDSYNVSDDVILENLINIINFRKENPDKVIILLGNHELHYLFQYSTHGCSGFRSGMYPVLNQLLNENRGLFKICHQIDNYIWSHAGISKQWYKFFLEASNPDLEGNLAEKINNTFNSSKEWIVTRVGAERGGLRGDAGGPLWADQQETRFGILDGYHQIVGHTPQKNINKFTNKDSSIVYCDVLQTKEAFYTIEI